MALLDGLFKKKYKANVFCNNCNSHSEVSVPMGVTILQFIENGACPNCSCATLIADYKQIDEFKERPSQPKMQILRPRMTVSRQRPQVQPRERANIPEPRPSTKPLHYKPLPQPEPNFEPQRVFKQPPVDFWTGKPTDENDEEIDISRQERRRRRRRGELNENY